MSAPKGIEVKPKIGRPTKYTDQTLGTSYDYIEHFEDHEDVIPSVAGLACVLDVSRDTIHTWAKEDGKEEFSDMLRKLQSRQERVLINKGLSGTFNANIAKLVLAKHDYSDKISQDLTSGGETLKQQITFVPVSNEPRD